MSIVLKDGTVLPDLPSGIPEDCSYRAICKSYAGGYTFIASQSPFWFVPGEVSGAGAGDDMYYSPVSSYYGCILTEDGSAWGDVVNVNGAPVQNTSSGTIVWSNHDILICTEADQGTGELYGTEIYFPNSLAKPPFVLPDGTELPALPEGVFEKYPYGVIAKGVSTADGSVTYLFTAATTERVFIPKYISGFQFDGCMSTENGYLSYEYSYGSADGWTGPGGQEDDGDGIPMGEDWVAFAGTNVTIVWTDHDILTVTAKNDDGTYEIGSDLYHRSDVNYRIYGGWLNSMGNQARRLGGVSGALKPGEMETAMKAASLSALAKDIVERTITTLNNEDFTSIGSSGMRHCAKLTDVVLPNVTTLGQYAFYQCTALKRVELPLTTSIGNYGFGNCSVLDTLILANTAKVCTLSNANAFTGTLIASGTGYIYVPSALLDSYKAATNWSTYAAQLRAIEDYPDI